MKTEREVKQALEANRILLESCMSTTLVNADNFYILSYGSSRLAIYRDCLEIQQGATAILERALAAAKRLEAIWKERLESETLALAIELDKDHSADTVASTTMSLS